MKDPVTLRVSRKHYFVQLLNNFKAVGRVGISAKGVSVCRGLGASEYSPLEKLKN